MAAFVGIDLAWKAGRDSGVCILETAGDDVIVRRLEAKPVGTDELADELVCLGDDVVVAIDAPLLLPLDGRTADRLAAKAYAKYHAAPYTPSLQFLARSGMAGPDLANALMLRGFSFDPGLAGRGKVAMEVFPHTCHVELFGLERRLSYKKGVLAARQAGMQDYALRLTSFLAPRLPALADAIASLAEWLAAALPGRRLKQVEDQLDAVTCAYTAWHVAIFGPAGTRIFGDWGTGAIVVPVLANEPVTSAPALTSP